MSQLVFHASLEAESYPFLGTRQPRTTLLRDGQDSGRTINQDATDTKAAATPQVMYMENCLPSVGGVASVGYTQLVSPIAGVTDITSRVELKSANGRRYQLAISASNRAFLLDMSGSLAWVEVTLPISNYGSAMVTTAFVQGDTYIHFANVGMIRLNTADTTYTAFPFTFVLVSLNGIDSTKILGCTGSTNYLIIYDKATIYWSSILNPTDFVPSLTTGADSTSVSDAKGTIQFVAPIPQGFIVYTNANAVSATYSANMRYPWNFREVPGSAGVHDPEQVSFDENFSEHMAWSNSGLMKINRIDATVQFPEVTDFITSHRYESFDWTNGNFLVTFVQASFKCKVTIIGSRYLVISYGIFALTDALVYDYALKRWGGLKVTHTDVFESITTVWTGARTYNQMRGTNYSKFRGSSYAVFRQMEVPVGTPKHSMCFVKSDGTITMMHMNLDDNTRTGVVLFGRYQYIRSRLLKILGYSVSSVQAAAANYDTKVFSSYDGQNISVANSVFTKTPVVDGIRNHLCSLTGINHIIGIKGAFDLTSVQLLTTLAGRK